MARDCVDRRSLNAADHSRRNRPRSSATNPTSSPGGADCSQRDRHTMERSRPSLAGGSPARPTGHPSQVDPLGGVADAPLARAAGCEVAPIAVEPPTR